jgi:site-specific recombinase XerD
MEDMGLEDEWLSQILGESTKKAYRRQLGYFKEFMEVKSVESLIKLRKKERNFETRIVQFFTWLQKDKGLSSNSARAACVPLQSLFTYAGIPIRIKNKLPKMHMKVETWRPTLEDVQKVYKMNGIEIKAWVSLSRDCPLRMGDLLKVTNEQIQKGEFIVNSQKESVIGRVYLSDETKILFQQLEKLGKVLPKTQKGIDKAMESACRTAGLEHRINQHLFRKLFLSTAINIGIPEVVYKILSFKTVPQELLTYYLDRNELKEYWKRIIEALSLEPRTNGRVDNIQEAIDLVMKVLRTMIQKEMDKEGVRVLREQHGEITDKQILEEYLMREEP